MTGFSGNLGELARLADGLGELGDLPQRVARAAAPKIEALVRAQLDAGLAPDGTPWPADLDGRQPLEGMSAFLSVEVEGPRITVRVDHPAAIFHQEGTVRMVQRELLPEDDLPATWEEAMLEALDEEIARAFGGP